ncbi:MAG TPA: peptide ABC transporter substrate-binding protein [Candidatus Acidoferrales bacterium]|nr:peptide ABC transporter substrate-binding protein [Candidatus Acidoferrales bacterium]
MVLCACALASACTKVGVQTARNANSYSIPGTLRYADVDEPTSLNPLLRLDAVSTDLDMFIFGFFFNLDDKMHFVPELATEVPTLKNGGISKDGLVITYHLRKGVRWHDGAPFTSRDVVFTTNAILNPSNNLQSRNGWDQIDHIQAVGDYEVKFYLKRPYAPAISSFFSEGGDYPVLPAHLLEKYPNINNVPFNADPIGTGPFKFVRWVHGDHIELVANQDYWRGPPKLQHIIFKIIPKDTTILVQLQTHEIDAWFRAPTALWTEYQRLGPEYRVQLEQSLVFSHMDFNFKNPLFQDVRVRRAIDYAIDRDSIIKTVTHSVNIPVAAEVSPMSWAYDPNVPTYPYNPTQAKALLAQAGWTPGPDGVLQKNGQRLAFDISAVTGGTTGEAVESIVQQELRQLGIVANIKNYPADRFFAPGQDGGIVQGGKYDVAFYAWVEGDDPDDYSLYGCSEFPPAGQNSMFWCDPTFDKADDAGRRSYDQDQRKKDYAIAQYELASQVPTIVQWFQRQIYITSTNFHGFKPAPATSSNWNSWEWTMQ